MSTEESEAPEPVKPQPKPVHVLVPEADGLALRTLARMTRVRQAEYLREGVDLMLAKYSGPSGSRLPPPHEDLTRKLESIVFRLDPERMSEVRELATATRVRQSEYLREAISEVLTKHAALIPEHRKPRP